MSARTPSAVSRPEAIVVGGAVLVAAWLRLRHLGLAEFKSDEALAIRIARDILHGDVRTVGLTSSAGAANPPLFVYLTAIPLAVRNDPLVATGFIGVVAAVTVGFTYLALRRAFGGVVAAFAAVMFATAPWAVLYGRHLWQPDLLPSVTLGLLWSLLLVLDRDRTRHVWLVPVWFCLALQLNFAALALVVPIAVVVAYRARAVHWGALAVGVVTAFALLGPWLAHNAKHGFPDVVALAKEGRGHGSGVVGAGAVEAIRQTANLVGVGGWRFVTGASQHGFTRSAGWSWTIAEFASVVTVGLLALGLATSVISVARGIGRVERWPWFTLRTAAAYRALLLTWLTSVWLSYATSARDRVQPHYLIVTFPVVFVVVALGVLDVFDGIKLPRGDQALGALAIAGAACWIAMSLSFQRFVASNGGTAGDYGITYDNKSDLAAAARARHLDVDDRVLQYLTAASFNPQPDARGAVRIRDRLRDPGRLSCDGQALHFGPLEGCFPAR